MYLHYHRKNFYWFKGLKTKRIKKLISNLKITEDLVCNIKYSDNRKRVFHDEKTLFLQNLYTSKHIKFLINFIKEKENLRITPIHLMYPLSYSLLDDNDEGLCLHYDTTGINTFEEPRYFGCNIYLNDDYEGGEIVFPSLNLKIKPEIGDLLFYRSNVEFPHYVKKVIKGQKWILQGYFRGKSSYE